MSKVLAALRKYALRHALALVVSLAGLAVVGISPALAQSAKPDILEIMELSGIIGDGTAQWIAKQVETINDTPKIKGVLLIVDTPGGGVLPSSVIYEELSKLKVPVVAWCNNLCASGGMYILTAPSVKYIGVRSSTIGGSVGVVMQLARFHRLLDFLRIDTETYVSGTLKDAGNPTRAGREDEKKYLQEINTNLANRFYELVQKARPKVLMDEVKTARIFIGPEIVRVGLADAVTDRGTILQKAKDLSGSKSIYTREELKKMSTAADVGPNYHSGIPTPAINNTFGDLPWLIETMKEIRQGESIKFEYRLPYQFN